MNNIFSKPSGENKDKVFMDSIKNNPDIKISDVETILIHKKFIYPDPNQPRKNIKPETIQERKIQMKNNGQKEAIEVHKGELREDGHTYFKLIDGECRWRAFCDDEEDELEYLRAEVNNNDLDSYSTLMSQLLHNDDGAEPLTPLERSVAYRNLLKDKEKTGCDNPSEKVAEDLGMSASFFSSVLSLSDLPETFISFSLENGISDTRVLNGYLQISKKGSDKDIELAKEVTLKTLKEGGKLREAVRDIINKVKLKTPKNKKKLKKKEKPVLTLTASDVSLTSKDNGGVLVFETPHKKVKIKITKEHIKSLQA